MALLALLSILPLTLTTVLALPQTAPAPAPFCTPGTTFPALYTFSNLLVSYAPSATSLGAGAPTTQSTASFTLTNSQTNLSESLTCNLRIGYQCQMSGTPKNPNLQVWLQLNLAAYFSFLERMPGVPCEGGRVSSVTGSAEMGVVCPETPLEEGMVCVGDREGVRAGGLVDFLGE